VPGFLKPGFESLFIIFHCQMKAGTHLYLQGLELVGGEPLMSVMRDAIPKTTFPVARNHCPLAGSYYTAWWQRHVFKHHVQSCTWQWGRRD